MRTNYFAVMPSAWATIVLRGWMSGSEHGYEAISQGFLFRFDFISGRISSVLFVSPI